MKKIISVILAAVLMLSLTAPALAAGEAFSFRLAVSDTSPVVGETITVTLTVVNNGGAAYAMYAMQDYVCFDPAYFQFVDDSIEVATQQRGESQVDLFRATALSFGNSDRNRVFINRAVTAGVELPASKQILQFQLKAQKIGTTAITHDTVEMLHADASKQSVATVDAVVNIRSEKPEPPDPPSGGGGGGGAPTGDATVPVMGGGESLLVKASLEEGVATVTVSDKEIAQVLTAGGSVDIDLTGLDGVVTRAVLPTAAARAVTDAKASLSVKMTAGIISLDAAALKTILAADTAAHMGLSLENVTAGSVLPGANPAVSAVFVLGADCGVKQVSDFGGGKATVFIPFTPAAGEAVTGYYMAHVGNGSALTRITGSGYNAATGCMEMTRGEFSTYAIVWEGLPFADVVSGTWYYDAVAYVTKEGLFNGTSATRFDPDGQMTRAMLVTVLARLDGQDTTTAQPWYAEAMAWGKAVGITDGTNLDGAVSREQLAAMLYRYAGMRGAVAAPDETALSAFTDASSVSDWAAQAMRWAVGAGIVTGKGGGRLDPSGRATRAEVATMLLRFAPD